MWQSICNFFRRLSGTVKCKDVDELIAYIPVGDIYRLANWVDQLTPWTEDKNPDDEWKDVNRTIAEGKGDCEDRAVVCHTTIRTWKGWTSRLLCVYPMDEMQQGHAVCAFERPDGSRGYIDGGVHLFYDKQNWGAIAKTIRSWVYSAHWTDIKGNVISTLVLEV